MLIDLSKRSEQLELLDDFSGGIQELRAVFDDINRVNSILGGNRITIHAISQLIAKHPQDHYTIVDMGCGDGFMLRAIANYCRKNNINVQLRGIDLNEEALQLAIEASFEYPEISYNKQDILQLEMDDLNCDIAISTLCMHHFKNKELISFLKKYNDLAKIGVIINDLHRSRLAYYLFKGFSLIFIRSKTAKIDGLISISRGFVHADLVEYSKKLPQTNHTISWKWAFRYVWIMQPNRQY